MSDKAARRDGFRSALVVAGVAVILFEMVAIVALQPLTTFSISLRDTYRVISLGGVIAIATIGGAVSLVPIGIAAQWTKSPLRQHPSRRRMIWSRINGTVATIGAVTSAFLVCDLAVSFGYLGLADVYPNFAAGPFWVLDGNLLLAPILLILATASSAGLAITSRFWPPRTQTCGPPETPATMT